MEPYYDYMSTAGPTPNGAGVNKDGIQFFGAGTASQFSLPKKMTLYQLFQKDHMNLWGMGAEAAAAAAVTESPSKVISVETIGGLALSFALGRLIAVPLIEYFAGNVLTSKQKTAVGVTAMIF